MQNQFLPQRLKTLMLISSCLLVILSSGCSRGLVSARDEAAIRERVFAELIADNHLPRVTPIISDGSGLREPTAPQSLKQYALCFEKEDTAEIRAAILTGLRARGMQAIDLDELPDNAVAAAHVLYARIIGDAKSMLVVEAGLSALGSVGFQFYFDRDARSWRLQRVELRWQT